LKEKELEKLKKDTQHLQNKQNARQLTSFEYSALQKKRRYYNLTQKF
jgi:hypothetical protein